MTLASASQFIEAVCPSCNGGDAECESCRGFGIVAFAAPVMPRNASTPCCGTPWVMDANPARWSCGKCGKLYDRRKAVGW